MNFADKALVEGTLFELYDSKGYNSTVIALQSALDAIERRLLRTKGEWTKRELKTTKALIQEEIKRAYNPLTSNIQKEMIQIGQIVAGVYSIKAIPKAAIERLMTGEMLITGYTFNELFQTTRDNHARQLRIILARNVAAGTALPQIVNEMRIKNKSLTKGQLKTATYTAIKQAREDAIGLSYKQLEADGLVSEWESLATLDGRTSEVCRSTDGVIYKMDYEEIPDKPPRHPNCRSRIIPATSSPARASMDGQVSYMTYGQWFKTKDAAFQRKVLGRTKYELFKQGRYKVGGIADLGKVRVTLDDIKDALK